MNPLRSLHGPVGFFDSGVGGLPYVEATRAVLPREGIAYLADREGFPYGTKTREEVRDRVLVLMARFIRLIEPKAVVIACNTASQAALEELRAAHPDLPVVGTVPAVKPAAERTRSGIIGVMATSRAVEDPYLDRLVDSHASKVKVLREAAQDLVSFVEGRHSRATPEERRAAVEPYVRRMVDAGADEIVLACTHFLHLTREIAEVAGPGVEVVDSRDGVARRLARVLEERGLLLPADEAAPSDSFLLTGPLPFEVSYGDFAAAFSLPAPAPLGGPPR